MFSHSKGSFLEESDTQFSSSSIDEMQPGRGGIRGLVISGSALRGEGEGVEGLDGW